MKYSSLNRIYFWQNEFQWHGGRELLFNLMNLKITTTKTLLIQDEHTMNALLEVLHDWTRNIYMCKIKWKQV